ncbi:MAG: TonB-dependent receptor plug domain-containing protein [Flavobacteriia bacterium]|nr:TonB-dependent receptor plug domain-containing protein [Flavobacteriia bacterium]
MLIGAQIYVPNLKIGVVTNTYGFYSLNIPSGLSVIEFRSTGLISLTKEIQIVHDTIINVELFPIEKAIEEVVINAKKSENVNSTKIGQMSLDIGEIKLLPAFMGEVDVLKTIQLLPGVSSVSEGGQGFYVRGGGPDQNLVLLDEAVVYNASHLFGFFSVFNSDAVKNVNLTKGTMPANFGGRMSSVLEVNMNEGNNKKFKVKGGLGLISSRLTVEGPLKKDKGSFVISARRTYIDVLMKALIPKMSPFAGSGYFFYDYNFKANYRLSKKDKIYLSGYYGKDLFFFGNKEDDFQVDMPWGNGIASLRWNHVFNGKLFLNVSSTYSNYQFSFGSQQDQFKFKLSSGISDIGGKIDFSYYPNSKHKVKWGLDYTFHTFVPSSVAVSAADVKLDMGVPQKVFGHESAIYLLDEIELSSKIKMNIGLRYSMYQQTGPFTRYIKGNISKPDTSINYKKGEVIQFYNGLEPRISFRFILDENSSIKAGYSYNNQYVHLTSMSAVSLPTDIWYPSTSIAKPQKGWQATAGYFKNFMNGKIETSVEIYYKGMRNLIEFKEGVLPADNVKDNTDNLLTFGKGWSYGIEFFVKKTFGKFTGWIGYTWAKTERKFPEINGGKVYPAKYDRRHDLSLVGTYKLNARWAFSGTFIYATGNTLTLPTAWYVQDSKLLFDYGARNSTRMAPYHRLDISATWYGKLYKTRTNEEGLVEKIPKRCRSNWSFSVYNVYNRANPFFLYVDSSGNIFKGDFSLKIKQVTLFPIIPSVTWNFEF